MGPMSKNTVPWPLASTACRAFSTPAVTTSSTVWPLPSSLKRLAPKCWFSRNPPRPPNRPGGFAQSPPDGQGPQLRGFPGQQPSLLKHGAHGPIEMADFSRPAGAGLGSYAVPPFEVWFYVSWRKGQFSAAQAMHFPTWHREGSGESPTIPVMDFMGASGSFRQRDANLLGDLQGVKKEALAGKRQVPIAGAVAGPQVEPALLGVLGNPSLGKSACSSV